MTFEEWWKLLKPAECDEVKPQFEDCWQQAYAAGRESMRKELTSPQPPAPSPASADPQDQASPTVLASFL